MLLILGEAMECQRRPGKAELMGEALDKTQTCALLFKLAVTEKVKQHSIGLYCMSFELLSKENRCHGFSFARIAIYPKTLFCSGEP